MVEKNGKVTITLEIEVGKLAKLAEILTADVPVTQEAMQEKVEKPKKVEAVVANPPKEEVPEEEQKAEPKKKEAKPKAKSNAIGLTEIQTLIRDKVGANRDVRDTIKAKLTELGAKGASDLAEDKYAEFHTFLKDV